MKDELPDSVDVLVVGAGPAGLACAACLDRHGLEYLLVERQADAAPTWRSHYDRLHLHTSRRFSALPMLPMPRSYPRYPSRDQVVAYFDEYMRQFRIVPQTETDVLAAAPSESGWTATTSRGPIVCRHLVIATGANGLPNRPTWPGMDAFGGRVLHSAQYGSGKEFAGQSVLVVGFGNSGGEIALDLAEQGAHPTISVRAEVNVIPRDVLGIPTLAIAIPLSLIPPRIADALSWPLLKLFYPSYASFGLRKASSGPFQQIAERGRIPLLDIGTIRAIRQKKVAVRPGIDRFVDGRVRFADGSTDAFDSVVLATGYTPRLPTGVEDFGQSPASRPPSLHFCGFRIAPNGMLRTISFEAQAIADAIARS